MLDATSQRLPPYHLKLPEWPKLGFGDEKIDGLVPTCRVKHWGRLQLALGNRAFNPPGVELIYRGQRRHEWQLTPTLGRYSASGSGVVDERRANEQKREFRLAMRGRGVSPELLNEDNELWAFGQHNGLATPLLDWSKSPFVALFFAFCDPDPPYEDPNPCRTIFVINKTALDELDPDLIVQPLRNDHTRLVNQAGLFTLSPIGSDTIVTRVFNLLADIQTINMDNPADVGRYIFKIHIPNEERRECLNMLRKMNIHHGSLFPDPIGASLYCNEWFGGRVDEEDFTGATATPAPAATRSKLHAKAKSTSRRLPATSLGRLENPLADILISAGVDASQAQIVARELSSKFNSDASIDWAQRASGSALVKVDTKRILRMNGIDREDIEPIALSIFEFLAGQSTERN